MSEVVRQAVAPHVPGRVEPLADLREERSQAIAALEAALAKRTAPALKTLERLRDLLTEAASSCDRVLSADAEADARQLAAPLDGLLALAASHGEARAQSLLAGARQEIEDVRRRLEQQVRDTETATARADELQRRNKELTVHLQSANVRAVEQQAAAENHRREIAAIREQLAVESSERARLSAQLDNVRTALGVTQPASVQPAQATGQNETSLEPAGSRDKGPAHGSPDAATSKHVEPPEPVKSDPVLTQYATELLQTVGAAYNADLESGLNPSQLVERLVGGLRHAQDLFAGLAARRGQPKASEFERCIAELVDSKSSSSFPRHLAVAAYATRDTSGSSPLVPGQTHAERPSVPATHEPPSGQVAGVPGGSAASRPIRAAGAVVVERSHHVPTPLPAQAITRRVSLGR
jgi:hypothetical protein